ncbi:MAG: PHB depolymerase family esterase [Capsulimonas sp.]|uniref:carboxylesterase family protein n=1 Tax=Capsulimonas sp. TaxID=2494211 RepID=UPI0032668313
MSTKLSRLARALLFAPVAILAIAVLSATPTRAAAIAPELVPFADRTVTIGDEIYKYQVFIPKHWDKKKKTPVILFLHGAGERGTDGALQTKNGVRLLIAQDADKFPAVIVCPQLRPEMRWTQPAMQDLALKTLDAAIVEFNGDPRQIYLTGLSLGGYGTWELARKYPKRWAAIAPVCGGVVYPPSINAAIEETTAAEKDPYFAMAQALPGMPIWDFHGQADTTIPVSESRQLVGVFLAHKADIRYSEYPGVGHSSWDNAYAEPGLLPWLLSHKLSK